MKFTWEFGERIRQIRKRSGMTQEEFGDVLSVSRQTINTYERDRQRPTVKMMERICGKFAVNPLWLFAGVGDPKAELDYASVEELRNVYGVSEDPLSPEQRSLVNFIVDDRDRARRMARYLWDETLSRFGGTKEEPRLPELPEEEEPEG